jgi:putative transcriptional regulator
MKKELFAKLVQSLEQAVQIHRGEAKPSRQFVFKSEDVRKIRAKLHKSQAEFARMIGVSLNTLQNWEQGAGSPLVRLARCFLWPHEHRALLKKP